MLNTLPAHVEIKLTGDAPSSPAPIPAKSAGPPKSGRDLVIRMVAHHANQNPQLKEMMKLVATRQALQTQFREFQSRINECEALIKHQRSTRSQTVKEGWQRDRPTSPATRTEQIRHQTLNIIATKTYCPVVTAPAPDRVRSAVKEQQLEPPAQESLSNPQPRPHTLRPPSVSLVSHDSENGPPGYKIRLLLLVVNILPTSLLVVNKATKSTKLGFLDLLADTRARIYRYLYGKYQQIKLYHQRNTQGIMAMYSKDSRTGLRFTCRVTEIESRAIYHNKLYWKFTTSRPVSSTIQNRFHDTQSVHSIFLPWANVAMLDNLLHLAVHFSSLQFVLILATGKLRTCHVPSHFQWHESFGCLRRWSGFPGHLQEALGQPER